MLQSVFSRRVQSRRKSLNPSTVAVVEALEDRTLLAGNVVATFNGETLELTGDDLSNQVQVLIDGSNGAFQVIGLNGTTINDQANFTMAYSTIENFKATMNRGSDELNVSCNGALPACLPGWAWIGLGNGRDSLGMINMGFKEGIDILGGQGEDAIYLDHVETAPGWFNDINIDGGANDDWILLYYVYAGEDLNIRGRGGSDAIYVDYSYVGDDLKIRGDNGHDDIEVYDSSIYGNVELYGWKGDDCLILDYVYVAGEVKMEGGDGYDDLLVYDSIVDWTIEMKGGKGKDLFIVDYTDIYGNLKIRGGDGSDLTIVDYCYIGGNLDWHGDKGNDGFIVLDTDIGGNLELNGGDGADLMAASGTYVYGEAWIAGNAGNDALIISDTPDGSNTVEWNLMIKMGDGDDVVHVCGVHTANAEVLIDGGDDYDRLLVEQMQNFVGPVTIMGFESENDLSVQNRTNTMISNLVDCFFGDFEWEDDEGEWEGGWKDYYGGSLLMLLCGEDDDDPPEVA